MHTNDIAIVKNLQCIQNTPTYFCHVLKSNKNNVEFKKKYTHRLIVSFYYNMIEIMT